MNFSLPSFFIGVGTVVGAIALGFGGGVLMTNSAVKETTTPAKVERAAHPDIPKAKIVARAEGPKAEPALPDATAAAADSTPPAPTTIPLTAQTASVASKPAPVDHPVAALPTPAEPTLASDAEQLAPGQIEQQRRAERRLHRKKLEAERRIARAQAVAKLRQPQFEVREQAKSAQERPELAFEREEDSGFNFFGRSNASRNTERE